MIHIKSSNLQEYVSFLIFYPLLLYIILGVKCFSFPFDLYYYHFFPIFSFPSVYPFFCVVRGGATDFLHIHLPFLLNNYQDNSLKYRSSSFWVLYLLIPNANNELLSFLYVRGEGYSCVWFACNIYSSDFKWFSYTFCITFILTAHRLLIY